MKLYCIYKLISPSEKCYVGQTCNISKRFSKYKKESKNRSYAIDSAITKYGWDNFQKEILEEKISEDKIDNLERFYIAELNTLSPNGYNLESGGNTNKTCSEETKEKLRKSNKERKDYLNLKGYYEKIRKKVLCFDLNNNFLKEYKSIKLASDELKVNATAISLCCKKKPKFKTAGGYKWEYKND